MEEFKVFVSRSFDRRDRELLGPMLDFCRAAGYQPIDTERASGSLPPEKIREAIAEARVFLGVLTIDRAEDGGAGRTHDWIPTEIGMAEFARLPIVLFLEEGVDYRPADHLSSWSRFSRSDPAGLWRAVVHALVELREDPRVRWGSGAASAEEQYRFGDDDVLIQIRDDGTMVHERHVQVTSNISSLRALRPIAKIITSSRLLGYFDSSLTLSAVDRNRTATMEVRRNDPAEVSYQVMFDPPLERGDTTAFTVVHTSRGSLPLLLDDVERLKTRDYVTRSSLSRQGHAVKVPTERLTLRLNFPQGYPLDRCDPRVNVTLRDKVGDSLQTAEELERVKGRFKVRHDRLELEVEQPKVDHAYYFEWRPPRATDVPAHLALGLDIPQPG